ncbi:hypothetical protein WA588_004373 [Blastocystis sp. NMH]
MESFYQNGYHGEEEYVCVLDSGFTPSSRLRTRFEVETVNFTSDPSTLDELNHGTASISILGSLDEKNPGLLPHAHLIALKVVDRNEEIQTSSVCRALEYARAHCTVAVLPLGGRDMDEPSIHHSITAAASAGLLIVVAAGNDGPSAGSVLSPADHPSVFSVGALRDPNHSLSGSSHGLRSHFQQRLLPEFVTLGFHIPVVDARGEETTASGTSVAAVVAAAVVSLLHQKLRATPSGIRCGLMTREVEGAFSVGGWNGHFGDVNAHCVVPKSVKIPQPSFPYFLQAVRTPRSFLVSVYSNRVVDSASSCSWIDVQRKDVLPFVVVFVVRVRRFDGLCVLRFGDLSLPVEQIIGSDQRAIVRWFEKPSGDTQWSNGESASTNYYRLYQALSQVYVVDVVEPDQAPDTTLPLVCLCFSSCPTTCKNQIWILSEMKRGRIMDATLSAINQRAFSETKQWKNVTLIPTQTCSLSYKGKRVQRIRRCLQMEGWETHPLSLRDYRNATVISVLETLSSFTVLFGVESLINDMEFYSSLGHFILIDIVRYVASKQPSLHFDSDEL